MQNNTGCSVFFSISLRSSVKGRGEGEGTVERESKETPAARTPHSAFCPHIKEACYQSAVIFRVVTSGKALASKINPHATFEWLLILQK